jgi:hypothetical protein
MAPVLLLVSGASGAGKSTARALIARELAPTTECVELGDVVAVPPIPTLAWRQRATEAVVRRAVQLQAGGRHLLLAGDPVAAGEVVASPSADRLDGIAVCLLDVDEKAQTTRLSARGDDPELFVHHVAFASWMRAHARDPGHMPEVLRDGGWDAMRWERVTDRGDGSWETFVLDTSRRTADDVATEVADWCRRAIAGHAPMIRSIRDPAR